jgi:hypothetical protein
MCHPVSSNNNESSTNDSQSLTTKEKQSTIGQHDTLLNSLPSCETREVFKIEANDSSIVSCCCKKDSKKKSLRFTTIEIRKYDRTLGDNPAVSNGPPIQLDWTYSVLPVVTVDDYETNRLPRRPKRHLSLSPITRRNSMYYHFGYSHDEIDRAADSVKKIQKQREVTRKLSKNAEKTQEVVQNVTRKIKRTFSREKLYYSKSCREEALDVITNVEHELKSVLMIR